MSCRHTLTVHRGNGSSATLQQHLLGVQLPGSGQTHPAQTILCISQEQSSSTAGLPDAKNAADRIRLMEILSDNDSFYLFSTSSQTHISPVSRHTNSTWTDDAKLITKRLQTTCGLVCSLFTATCCLASQTTTKQFCSCNNPKHTREIFRHRSYQISLEPTDGHHAIFKNLFIHQVTHHHRSRSKSTTDCSCFHVVQPYKVGHYIIHPEFVSEAKHY